MPVTPRLESQIFLVMREFQKYLSAATGTSWDFTSSSVSMFTYGAEARFVSVGIPGWGGSYTPFSSSSGFRPHGGTGRSTWNPSMRSPHE